MVPISRTTVAAHMAKSFSFVAPNTKNRSKHSASHGPLVLVSTFNRKLKKTCFALPSLGHIQIHTAYLWFLFSLVLLLCF